MDRFRGHTLSTIKLEKLAMGVSNFVHSIIEVLSVTDRLRSRRCISDNYALRFERNLIFRSIVLWKTFVCERSNNDLMCSITTFITRPNAINPAITAKPFCSLGPAQALCERAPAPVNARVAPTQAPSAVLVIVTDVTNAPSGRTLMLEVSSARRAIRGPSACRSSTATEGLLS